MVELTEKQQAGFELMKGTRRAVAEWLIQNGPATAKQIAAALGIEAARQLNRELYTMANSYGVVAVVGRLSSRGMPRPVYAVQPDGFASMVDRREVARQRASASQLAVAERKAAARDAEQEQFEPVQIVAGGRAVRFTSDGRDGSFRYRSPRTGAGMVSNGCASSERI